MKKKKQPNEVTIAYVALGILIAGVMTLFGISAFLRVNSIAVEGTRMYTPEQVAEASGIARGDNLLYLNTRNAANRITVELSYINTVEVQRDMPDTLIIRVTERSAIAYIPHAGNAAIIDSTGRVLDLVRIRVGEPIEANGNRLIEIRGVPLNDAEPGSMPDVAFGSDTSFSAMQNILSSMEREGVAADVNYLDVTNIINISFGYMDMYRVVIGGERDSRQKISGLLSYISQVQEAYPNARGVFNMSDPTGEYSFRPD